MNLVEQFRRYADEAFANALAAPDSEIKQAWLSVADDWNALAAARLERLQRKVPQATPAHRTSRREIRWRDLR